jgi:hypothetical protein
LTELFVTLFRYFPAGTVNGNAVITERFSCEWNRMEQKALSVTTRVFEMENFVITKYVQMHASFICNNGTVDEGFRALFTFAAEQFVICVRLRMLSE